MAWLPAASASQTATSLTAAPPGAAEDQAATLARCQPAAKKACAAGHGGAVEHACLQVVYFHFACCFSMTM